MFSHEQRSVLRSELLQHAAHDQRITAAAITGSAAQNREDQWSDIDLAFAVADSADFPLTLSDWTAHLYHRHSAVHHTDLHFGPWTYRVFLLRNTLQVDLAFVPESDFRPLAPSFRLIFGKGNDPVQSPPQSPTDAIGMAWLYALHARSSIARGRLWQAEYMVSGMRDHTLTLACLRHGLAAAHARGFDRLPPEVTSQFTASLVRHLDLPELSRAFRVVVDGLLREIRCVDTQLAARLHDTILLLTESAVPLCEPQLLPGPIQLAEYDPQWPVLFEREAARIRSALGDRALRIEHTGSTSVPDLPAKPIIDILLAVADSAQECHYAPALQQAGYQLRIREPEWFQHRMFHGPDTNVNLHVFSHGASEVDRILTFRDWLRKNPADRDLYARTKRALAANHWTHIQAYADAKTGVIDEILLHARAAGSFTT